MPHRMTEAEIQTYREKGYVVPDYALPDDVLSAMRDEYEKLLADNRDLGSDFLLGPHQEKPGTQGVKGSRAWFDFATHPDLMEMAAQLIGDDIILWGTT
ncbi:MAG: hypothetical protein GWM98_15160, partial [Nitrospinaceae bacterium]|nr:hypothetical protein [Nitrospinaceae bacterium]